MAGLIVVGMSEFFLNATLHSCFLADSITSPFQWKPVITLLLDLRCSSRTMVSLQIAYGVLSFIAYGERRLLCALSCVENPLCG